MRSKFGGITKPQNTMVDIQTLFRIFNEYDDDYMEEILRMIHSSYGYETVMTLVDCKERTIYFSTEGLSKRRSLAKVAKGIKEIEHCHYTKYERSGLVFREYNSMTIYPLEFRGKVDFFMIVESDRSGLPVIPKEYLSFLGLALDYYHNEKLLKEEDYIDRKSEVGNFAGLQRDCEQGLASDYMGMIQITRDTSDEVDRGTIERNMYYSIHMLKSKCKYIYRINEKSIVLMLSGDKFMCASFIQNAKEYIERRIPDEKFGCAMISNSECDEFLKAILLLNKACKASDGSVVIARDEIGVNTEKWFQYFYQGGKVEEDEKSDSIQDDDNIPWYENEERKRKEEADRAMQGYFGEDEDEEDAEDIDATSFFGEDFDDVTISL